MADPLEQIRACHAQAEAIVQATVQAKVRTHIQTCVSCTSMTYRLRNTSASTDHIYMCFSRLLGGRNT
jgi:hypothetical protein